MQINPAMISFLAASPTSAEQQSVVAAIQAATDYCSAEVGNAAKNVIIAGLICAKGLVKYGDCIAGE